MKGEHNMTKVANSTCPGSSQTYIVAQVRPLSNNSIRLQIPDDSGQRREFDLSVDPGFVQALGVLGPSTPSVSKTIEARLASLEKRVSNLE